MIHPKRTAILMLLALSLCAHAQSRHEQRKARMDSLFRARRERVRAKVDSLLQVHEGSISRVDSALAARYGKITYDPRYIARPPKKLTLKARMNLSGTALHARGDVQGEPFRMDLSTTHRATLSFGVNYQGLTAGVAINPAALSGRSKDNEFSLNIYNNRYAVDASFQMSKTLSGDVTQSDRRATLEKGSVRMNTLNVTGYYIFNHNRFSIPAAMSQSYIQKRSAGSWILGLSYQGGSTKTTSAVAEPFPKIRLHAGHFGIGGGYGYNYVWRKGWLAHITALPTLVVINSNNFSVNDERRYMHSQFPDLIFNESLAIIHTLSTNQFMGATFTISNSLLGNSSVKINQNKWRARLVWGIRL